MYRRRGRGPPPRLARTAPAARLQPLAGPPLPPSVRRTPHAAPPDPEHTPPPLSTPSSPPAKSLGPESTPSETATAASASISPTNSPFFGPQTSSQFSVLSC